MEEQPKEENLRLFEFDGDSGEFKEIHSDDIPADGIKVILEENPGKSYALFMMDKYLVWLYHGSETSVQVKFTSAREITRLRDEVLIGAKIMTVDQGSEPLPFQFVTKMADPADYDMDTTMDETFKPAYTGTEEDETLLEKISLEKLALLLEQVPTPNGYEREVLVHQDNLYAIKNVRRCYMGSEIEEIELVAMPRNVEVDNGSYLAEDLVPRLLFENGRLVLVEFLRKTGEFRQREHIFNEFQKQ